MRLSAPRTQGLFVALVLFPTFVFQSFLPFVVLIEHLL